MNEHKKISICIASYNRVDVLFESFVEVAGDERVGEIVIVDDCSSDDIYSLIKLRVSEFPKFLKEKIVISRNNRNLDCYANKRQAIIGSTNDFSILLDSDNIIKPSYLDKIFSYDWNADIIFTPSFAEPHFDFRAYEGLTITKENVAEYIDKPMFETMLNAANYFVNKVKYLATWDEKVDPVTSDSVYMAYRWLAAGKKIFVVPGLEYFHRVWNESHYQKNVNRTPVGFHESTLQKLRELK